MNPAVLVRLILYTPMIIGAAVYCWRHGIRLTKDNTLTGTPAKIAACLLFFAAGLMVLSVIFQTEAAHLADLLDQKFGGQPQRNP